MSTTEQRYPSPAVYLAVGRAEHDAQHEYHANERFPIASASRQHNRLTVNLTVFSEAIGADASLRVATLDLRLPFRDDDAKIEFKPQHAGTDGTPVG